MPTSANFKNQRQSPRLEKSFPVTLQFGIQIILQGVLKDISLKSAFVKIKESVYLEPNDELIFTIQPANGISEEVVQGSARISRIVKGEGIAIFFTRLDQVSLDRLKEWLA